jgi:transcriptional regulator with XRE-family HTH domain
MTPVEDAPVQRRRLRGELRRARKAANLTQRDVAEAMDWSLSKLVRIENGSVGISTTDLRALLQHYGIADDAQVDRFVQMARAGKEQQGWWTAYRESTSPQYTSFLGYENSASVIEQFEPMLVPGLLQNEDYARAILQELAGSASKERLDEWVELRMRRQEELFERPSPPEVTFVLHEAVLRPWVGGSDVMRRQLRRLLEETTKDYLTLEVVPFRAGAHPGMKGPFVLLQFEGAEEDVLFQENIRGDMIGREERAEIGDYRDAFARLRELAQKGDANRLIDEALKRLK